MIKMQSVIVDNHQEDIMTLYQFIKDELQNIDIYQPQDITERFYQDYDIYFLDIEMQPSGIEIVKTLNQVHPQAIIIFITHHDSYIFQTQIYNPFYFIRKTHLQEDLSIALSLLKKQINQYLNVSFKNENTIIYFKTIKYIEIYRGKITLNTTHKNIQFWQTLSELEKVLPSQFIKIHRSYIINKNYIQSINSHYVIIDGEKLPLSRSYKQKVYEKLSQDI